MASLLPRAGLILDGGCGHGLLSLTLAFQSPRRKVLGLDHSPSRISAARKAATGLGNLSFRTGDYASPPRLTYDGIALIDVLHYLPYEKQAQVLGRSFRRLRRGGMLVFREVDRRPGPASLFNRFHEKVMTGLGFTKAEGLYFRSGGNGAGWPGRPVSGSPPGPVRAFLSTTCF
jgi:2-polyprenyl-6-hydroxyphenyl methylase/3-demethylubiquinone-9 3-methyltransferase